MIKNKENATDLYELLFINDFINTDIPEYCI